ncbi:MAG: GNAT family N-acetyltransferase [Chloroflexi bacterium]|nr:GNAT family N-acetyltransferase [Chloroflexota bacterium]|tara:strand:+ start:1131 stop:1571 length:441 start_codon:yes stop_codon:yes gene_type:complete
MNLTIREINKPDDYLKAFGLRIEVFIFEQKCPIEEEFDNYDNPASESIQFIVEEDGKCIGTARIVNYKDKIKIERVCISKDKRKLNVGSKLMNHIHNYLIKNGIKIIEISAQITAINFYKKLGYIEEGVEYIEARIRHIKMKKLVS